MNKKMKNNLKIKTVEKFIKIQNQCFKILNLLLHIYKTQIVC